ncbi:MAG: DUF3822 family protein [Bacteroidota bacterium]
MGAAATLGYAIAKKAISNHFDLEKRSIYTLTIQIGITDMQLCVVNRQTGRCLTIEDYRFENVRTINNRLDVVKQIYERHPYLSYHDWGTIKLSLKTHKYALVPASVFLSEHAEDYLSVNAEVNQKIEEIQYYRHISCNAIHLFAVDRKLVETIKSYYPKKQIELISQACALIEGTLQYDDHSMEKTMFCLSDKGILHIIVSQNQKLTFYNQFAVRKPEDYLKYIMLVMQETRLNPKSSNVIMWGGVSADSSIINTLKKYIRNISLGSKPKFLRFEGQLDELQDHKFFDVYSIFLCE